MPKTKIIFPHKISVNLGDIHLEVIKEYMERFNRDQSTAIRELILHGINYVFYVGEHPIKESNHSNNHSNNGNKQKGVVENNDARQ